MNKNNLIVRIKYILKNKKNKNSYVENMLQLKNHNVKFLK